jgi:hypothetical protein
MIFNFHGTALALQTDEVSRPIAEWLSKDFSFFLDDQCGISPDLHVTLHGAQAPGSLTKGGWPSFKNRMALVRGWGRKRFYDFGLVNAVCNETKGRRFFQFYGADQTAMTEAAYTTILSAVGETLDKRGFHRVHGLGVQFEKTNALVLLPTGGGKSAMALLLLQTAGFRLYSDESPLLKGGKIMPFPVRIAIRPEVARILAPGLPEERIFQRKLFAPKALFEVNAENVATAATLKSLMIGRRSSTARIFRVSRWRACLPLFFSMVVGLGIAQMAEHVLRPTNLTGILGIGISRLKEAWQILRLRPVYIFEVSPDARENARVLKDFLIRDSQSGE